MLELVDSLVSEASARKSVRVRVPLGALIYDRIGRFGLVAELAYAYA